MQRFARGFLVGVSVLNGVAGIVCGALFLASPDGGLMQAGALLPVIRALPLADVFFQDFSWIGIAMLLALGVPNTLATVLLVRRSDRQYVVTLVAGILLVAWTVFEFIFMFNALALVYFAIGIMAIAASALLLRHSAEASL